ncbi:aldose 1-epimerase family protein [Aquibium carbonis]|uniref:Aldose 1-epimerase family protein n=1 Tax=Aquibium carbonis TaxID=2495581 RepID=A0A3R9ZQF4_9HYPH|nr:aldose 1-epimerase family protein [Aquibium carbonis]RST85239.1 aldose 1-epimerase family protein [Aquibium carbonis]
MRIVLEDDAARAEIALRGAELVHWSVGGRPLTWEPDPAVWAAVSPILFPVVGWARGGVVRVDGRTYPMPVHGFAAGLDFEIVAHEGPSAVFRLRDGPATAGHYPFRFALTLHYRLEGPSLAVTFSVENCDDRAMPYALGIHPGFRWPLSGQARDGHSVAFETAEEASVPVIAPGGLFSKERRPIPLEQGRLALNDAVLAQEALCLLDVRSRSLRYAAPDGSALRIAWEDFAHCAIWSRPPAPFVSIESWTGHGDPVGFEGALSDKPSMRLLAPGETGRHAVRYTFEGGCGRGGPSRISR